MCLTLENYKGKLSKYYLSKETLNKTVFKFSVKGDLLNLEKSLKYGDRISGHFVQGHVDCTSEIRKIACDGVAKIIEFEVPSDIMTYIVQKGFVCVDGVSLTVVECGCSSFTITLIPYTSDHTVLGAKCVGDSVNVEVDMIAKYVERVAGNYK